MPFGIFRTTVSFREMKKPSRDSDPCMLYSIRSLEDVPEKDYLLNHASTLPRSHSEPACHEITRERGRASFSIGSSVPELSSDRESFVMKADNSNVAEECNLKAVVKVKPVTSDHMPQKAVITKTSVSLPQPLYSYAETNDVGSVIIRRIKENSPRKEEERKRNRRKGLVWTESSNNKTRTTVSISNPVAISQPLESVGSLEPVRQRSTEEQLMLLQELVEQSNSNPVPSAKSNASINLVQESTKKSKKPKPRAVESLKGSSTDAKSKTTSSGRMADKIQRTIRALYDGGTRRSSFEKLDEDNNEDELDSLKLKPVQFGEMNVENSSPKADKRSTRKSRSPKPARRTTVPLKDVDGSRRFKWRGSVNRIVKKFGQGQTLMQGGTFDVLLEDCPPSANNDLVPFVVDLCCRIVEEKGLSFTGIYRVPGNSGTLSALEEDLNQRGADAVDLENDERFRELNVVSSLLKCFFRKLPDPLFTNELYDNFIAMNRKKDPEERLTGLRRLIHMLPAPHYETLKFLVNHLSKVSENSQANKMEIRNLAIVFGPTLVRSTAPDNVSTMVTDMSDQCRIVESVLQHASWFFSDEKLQGSLDRTQSVPSEGVHEPVPNINHLLANVGRTPGDTSDSTSESSKSKASCASEKESFSRDVMEMIFGAGKRWLQNPQRGAKENTGEESSDDEYGFKEAERNKSSRVALQRPKSPPKSPPATTSSNSRYQVSKPAASGIRAGLANRGQTQHLPLDIHARLYDFYVESLERIARTDLTRPLPYFSSSSTDTSPQVTPRTSFFGAPQPQQLVRSYPPHVRRPSDGKPYNGAFPSDGPRLHGASAPPLPRRYRPHLQDERNKDFKPFLATSTPLRSESDNQFIPVSAARSQPEVSSISKESLQGDEESDSDTSIYVGDTLEEKLKNLTNVDKKLERRPSRRHANRNHSILMKVAPTAETLKSSNKKLSAPSMQAGEKVTTDNIHMYPVKKTSRELYQQRKQQRQQHRDGVRSIRTSRKQLDPSLCASDENVFSHFDSRRQILRHPSHDDVMSCQGRRPRQIKEKIRRRHTLAGNDFPGQEFWEKGCHASLQNIARDAPGSAIARLCPQLGASAPSVAYMPSGVRVMGNSATYRPEISRKTESYL